MAVSDEPWSEDASRIEATCRRMLPGLVGVYLPGSAALGGFTAASDLDVLVIADGPVPIAAVGQSLLGAVAGFPLAAAAPAPPFPFVVHVASPYASWLTTATATPT
jgi:predicted nucleotidyltransferase